MVPRDAAACLALTAAPLHSRMRVVTVDGDRRLVNRLAALGLVPGAHLEVRRRRGTLVVAMGGSRLALGTDAADSIIVEPD